MVQVRAQLAKHLKSQAHRRADSVAALTTDATSRGGGGSGGTTGTDSLRRALVRGFFANAAEHTGGGHYRSVLRGASLRLHPNSVLFGAPPDWLVFHETVFTKHELILSATKVDQIWLTELAPHFYVREQQQQPAPRPAGATMGEAARGSVKRSADAAALGGRDEPPPGAGGFAALLGGSLAGHF